MDDILRDMGQELSQENRKAVRILGYNSMPVTDEALTEVRETYFQVENVVRAMTPARTLSLIRDGVNPLTMSLDELETYLYKMDAEPEAEADRYARFLYELEKNGQISESERGAYIGIYRAFHQIEKADGAAIGSLINQGGELTLGNLLTAARNRRVGRMDYTVDDDFGLLTGVVTKGKSISAQIEEGVAQARAALHGETKQMWNEAANADKGIYEVLENTELALSAENIMAAKEIFTDKGTTARRVKDFAKRLDTRGVEKENPKQETESVLDDLAKSVVDKFTDFDSAQKAMEDWENRAKEVLSEVTDLQAKTFSEMKNVTMCFRQLSVIGALRRQENYEVPMEINGEMTSVNLVLVHNAENKGTVSITMQTESLGKAGVRFRISENTLDSYFIADSEMGKERLQTVGETILEQLRTNGLQIGEANYVNSHSRGRKEPDLLTFSQTDVDNNSKTVATKRLYEVAKVFLTGMQEAFR